MSLETRTEWASLSWLSYLDIVSDVYAAAPNVKSGLLEAGVLRDIRDARGERIEADAEMNAWRELICRSTISCLSHAMWLFQGGLYGMLALFVDRLREEKVLRYKQLFLGMMAFRQAMSTSLAANSEAVEFDRSFFWADQPLYLMAMQSLHQGDVDAVLQLLRRTMGGLLHSKGCESTFRYLRRLVRK